MLQVRMLNRREYRVVAVNGKVEYIAHIPGLANRGTAFPGVIMEKVMDFAQKALNTFSVRCVGLITKCILRVDVMINNCNELVVNEFEGFEASKDTEDMGMVTYVNNSICNFWYNQLIKIIT